MKKLLFSGHFVISGTNETPLLWSFLVSALTQVHYNQVNLDSSFFKLNLAIWLCSGMSPPFHVLKLGKRRVATWKAKAGYYAANILYRKEQSITDNRNEIEAKGTGVR